MSITLYSATWAKVAAYMVRVSSAGRKLNLSQTVLVIFHDLVLRHCVRLACERSSALAKVFLSLCLLDL